MKALTLTLTMAVVLGSAGVAMAMVVIPPTHVGDTDPATEGFTPYAGTSGSSVGGYWEMPLAGVEAYTASPAINTGDGDFTFTAIGTVDAVAGTAPDHFGFAFLPGTPALERAWKTTFLADLSGIWDRQAGSTGGVPNSSYTVPDGVGVEHTYQVVREGTVYKTYVDGVYAFTNAEGGGGTIGNLPFNVGNGTSAMSSRSSWRLWQFEEGIHIVRVPEPASLGLLGLGVLLGVLRRRR